MRILHIEDEVWDSGISHYALTLAGALKDKGHEVHFWGRQGSVPCVKARELGLAVEEFSHPWLTLPRLRARVKAVGVEVINGHTGSSHSLAAAVSAGLGVPVVRTRGDARPPSGSPLSRALAKRTSAFIAANSLIKTQLEGAYPGSRVELVFQGLPAPPPSPISEDRNVGIVGRLDPVKGHETLIAASGKVLAEFPSSRFLAAGSGTAERDVLLRALAAKAGLGGSFEFLGYVPSVDEFISRCRVGVVASTGSEAVSRAALEWMSHGRPVVASRVGCLPDLVEDGVTGLLVPPGEPDALADALLQLFREPGRTLAMGAKARERFGSRFCVERFVSETERIYRDLLHRLPS
ncbi:MAG: glycosyltransferase family 4 protein [Elusimicrobia bacterium]|nr:glycosyltransferase family 4 protein [Elusimicrobiota bacterium]